MALGKYQKKRDNKRALRGSRIRAHKRRDGVNRKFARHLDLVGAKPMEGLIELPATQTPTLPDQVSKVSQVTAAATIGSAAQATATAASNAASNAQQSANAANQNANQAQQSANQAGQAAVQASRDAADALGVARQALAEARASAKPRQ